MNRHSKLPARFLLVLLGTILIVAGLTSVSLATETTSFHGTSYFDVVSGHEFDRALSPSTPAVTTQTKTARWSSGTQSGLRQ